MKPLRAVLFDLDGTLADTAPDLIDALNAVRRQEGLAALADDALYQEAGQGALGLLRVGLGVTADDAEYPRLQQAFLAAYAQGLGGRTQLFAGMNEVLQAIVTAKLRWGIVTNKVARFTEPLLLRLGMVMPPEVVVSGDTTPKAKPDGLPLLTAAAALNIAAEDCVYVGDHWRDIVAAKNAGMRSIRVLWGYVSQEEDVKNWPSADFCVANVTELKACIESLRHAR